MICSCRNVADNRNNFHTRARLLRRTQIFFGKCRATDGNRNLRKCKYISSRGIISIEMQFFNLWSERVLQSVCVCAMSTFNFHVSYKFRLFIIFYLDAPQARNVVK